MADSIVSYSRRARCLRGAAALIECLAMIGNESATDATLAQRVVESESDIEDFLRFALPHVIRDQE